MGILMGGKPITAGKGKSAPQQTRLGKHRLLTAEQVQKRHPAEPFPPIDSFRADTLEHRYSVASDLKGWVEQRLGEIVPLADESEWLRLQLRDPALEGHSMRQDAMERHSDMETQIAELASDVAYLEAHCDRIWQSLDESDRGPLATSWVADNTDERIICNAWTRIAPVGFRWPLNYSVRRIWFNCLAAPLIRDMEEHGLKEGIPLGEQVDPFEVEEINVS